jgi:hypothetical protein
VSDEPTPRPFLGINEIGPRPAMPAEDLDRLRHYAARAIQPTPGMCDFCGGLDGIAWVYPADEIRSIVTDAHGGNQRPAWQTNSPWGACAGCADVLEQATEAAIIAGLSHRLREHDEGYQLLSSLVGRAEADRNALEPAKTLWRAFLASRSGPRRRA